MSLYRMCQDAEAISGHRMGVDENLTCIGRLGNNGKGTHRAVLETLCGTHDQSEHFGYTCVFTAETLQAFAVGPAPKQEMSNAQGCKFIFADDLDVGKPLNSAFVRTMCSTSCQVTAHAKNSKSQSWYPVARLDFLTNDELSYAPTFKKADHRRQSVLVYGMTFFSPDDEDYDPGNPHHRLVNAEIRDNVSQFLPELVFWYRCLAGCSKLRSPRPSYLAPRPPEVREEASRLNPNRALLGARPAAAKKFVEEKLRLVAADTTKTLGEKPSTAADVQQAFVRFCAGLESPLIVNAAEAHRELSKCLLHVGSVTKVAGTSVKALYKKEAGSLAQTMKLI